MADQFVGTIRRAYAEHRDGLFTYALALTGNREAAEDAIQSVFASLLRKRRCPREIRPYLFRCVRNAAIDENRSRRQATAREGLFAEANGSVTEAEWHRYEDLQQALDALGDDERECIVLKLMNGLTFREISVAKRVSVNTAASWYRRGLDKIRAHLEEEAE